MIAAREALRELFDAVLAPALPSAVWLGVFLLFPWGRGRNGLLALSAATTALQFRDRIPAWLIVHVTAWVLLGVLMRRPTAGGVRWRTALWIMYGWSAAFIVGRFVHVDRGSSWFFATTFPGRVLDMLVYLRLLTAFWEVGSGRIKAFAADALWGWLMMPWAGALLRLSEFLPQWPTLTSGVRPALDVAQWRGRALDWCGHVAFGLGVLTVDGLIKPSLAGSRIAALLWSGFVVAPMGFYLFSHLTARTHQMMAAWVGLRIPDNYRFPIGRPNLSDFWANWNITYTNVFRDLFFYQRWGLKKANPYLNSIVLFTLVGFWHAQNAYWVIWGFLHGVGFAGFLYWRHSLMGLLATRWNIRLPLGPVSSGLITYGFVCLGWLAPPQIIRFLDLAWTSVLNRIAG